MHLEEPGGICRMCRYLELCASIENHLDTSVGIWGHVEALGAHPKHLEVSEIARQSHVDTRHAMSSQCYDFRCACNTLDNRWENE